LSYQFTINDSPFYAATEPQWQAYGRPAFSAHGQPAPYGPGTFTVVLNAVSNDSASLPFLGGDFAESGTFKQLVNICLGSLSSGYLQTFHTYDPRSDTYTTIYGRINLAKLLNSLKGGAAIPSVTLEVNSAFLASGAYPGYYGGDPSPITTAPPYIPGDPLPAPDPNLTYGWNIGRWDYGLWGQGEGV
jgi:hypothetical protein